MFRLFRSEWYESKLNKLSKLEIDRVSKFEQSLKESPFSGKPLGYPFLRQKKFDGKRLIFLVYEEHKCIFLVTITDKKIQQEVIDLIKANLDIYKEDIEKLIKGL
ncbi:MAG: hypothetical protein KKD48_03340 [Nanoarchaeota archaeon]|nr:hypothetical protein [Nanoarchaeota archaeon]